MKLTLQTYLLLGNNIISWQWDFGDGGNTSQNPSYVYQNSGIFTVTLNVLDDKGQRIYTFVII